RGESQEGAGFAQVFEVPLQFILSAPRLRAWTGTDHADLNTMFSKTIFSGFILAVSTVFAGAATAGGVSQQANDACNRRMRSQVRKFSLQVKRNLEEISGIPLMAEWVDPKATGLIAAAFNVKPEDVEKIY